MFMFEFLKTFLFFIYIWNIKLNIYNILLILYIYTVFNLELQPHALTIIFLLWSILFKWYVRWVFHTCWTCSFTYRYAKTCKNISLKLYIQLISKLNREIVYVLCLLPKSYPNHLSVIYRYLLMFQYHLLMKLKITTLIYITSLFSKKEYNSLYTLYIIYELNYMSIDSSWLTIHWSNFMFKW